jgi:hypothetical protein
MVEQNPASRGAPPRGAALSTAGRIADLAAKGSTRVCGREPKTESSETPAPDSLHRSDSSGPVDRADANPAPVPGKRQLWTYSGLGIETHDSAQFRFVSGQLQRSKKPQQLRGLNENHNHEMKEIFKGAATRASCGTGPFHDFYAGLLAKGMRPEMARLTLARKIAAITLTLWKKGARFDAEQLKPQAA